MAKAVHSTPQPQGHRPSGDHRNQRSGQTIELIALVVRCPHRGSELKYRG